MEQNLIPNTTYNRYVGASNCGTTSNSIVFASPTLAQIPATAVTTFTAVDSSLISVAWTANGNPVDVTTYTVVMTTSTPYPNGDGDNVSFSTLPAGASLAATFQGLYPNTTYYFFADARNYAGIETAYVPLGAVSTLAVPPQPGPPEFLWINGSSVAVAWTALPPSQPGTSSMSCEGYSLLASSNDFGALSPAGAPLFSSVTYSFLASTLTIGSVAAPLDLSNTYYFQVGSLNWAGVPNYTQLQRLNFQITQSTNYLSFGAMDPFVARSTISTSSMVVTNVGNWPVTIALSASTATVPSSPWTLSTSSGIDTVALLGAWYAGAVGPGASVFDTYLTTTTTLSQAIGNYSTTSESGYQLEPGSSVTLWVEFFMPTSTISNGHETLQVSAQPEYP